MVFWLLFRQRSVISQTAREWASQPDARPSPEFNDESPGATPAVPGEVDLVLPDLQIPDDLIEVCARGDCVLYVGAGLSARAGLPLWRPFITNLLDWSTTQGLIEPEFSLSLHSALEQGDVDRVADSLVSRVRGKQALDILSEHIRKEFAGAESGTLSDVHSMLPEIGFGAALTTNFDHLLERAFGSASRPVSVRLPREVEAIRGDLSQRRFFILKLYGDVDRSESLILSPAQYEEAIQGDRPFADVMQEIFLTRTILFLGCSLHGMDSYLRGLRFQPMSTPRHYAVIGVSDQGWRVVADGLARRYGIKVLPYAAGHDHAPLPRFVGGLQQAVASRSASRSAADAALSGPGSPAVPAARRPFLRSLELKNIGPFEQIQLEFNSGWTILLGDNGVGKSTILKAIALAVAGEHAGALAGRLLKVGTTQGQITIRTTSDQTYVTEIFTNSLGRADARSIGARAFGGEMLVLGFPPARAIAAGPAKAPQGAKGGQAPVPQDVLPILSGQPDPRILEIKQWIVNLDYLRARSAPDEAKAIQDLLHDYFRGMRTLLDIDIKSWRVADNDVLVTTVDGELPMDAMSQGTVSIFGWVGALLQRQFDIQGRPGGAAIALVDEIDAHMHPEWQQAMVSRLKKAFPEVQFIVTTHSPFLAIGRTASEIIHILRERRTGKLLAESPTYDTTYMGVGNVLVSRLFGLQSKHDLEVQRDLLIRRRLSVKPVLTEQERAELTRIETSLGNLNPAENIEDPALKAFVEQFNMRTRALGTSEVPDAAEMRRQKQVANEIIDEIIQEDDSRGKQADAASPPRQGGGGKVKSS
jgi:predicted ATPase